MNFELLGFDIVVGLVSFVLGYVAGRLDLTVNLVKGGTSVVTKATSHPATAVVTPATVTPATVAVA